MIALSMLSTFRTWFAAQSLQTQRAVVRERLLAYADDPLTHDVLKACPADVRDQFAILIVTAKTADWSVVQ